MSLDKGKMDQTKGPIKESVGKATNNEPLENEGKQDKVAGKAKEKTEDAKNSVNDAIDKFKQ
ncbi:CsbD family protein [Staphylococcus agnetis]|uniref:CsbD family protein n=1 Tax=Staphylococcus agnetis TaxID=985762 RepID=UPI00208F0CA0|nr:CsbD family protein [Staphylococcus agnetis]MCO4340955.1 CsbD family protein [Staphylococcus agnetis]MCO4342612.1 CsbD family protein [Staphylococcus agnetis]MCO4350326.1 CsbD family protein [Staphylococcus agnetis]MCO4352067.1 CsbD family protein [Staphylococcus agnetis]MCO4366939.1 CsbD family protein [Staphylococcus agnetis]